MCKAKHSDTPSPEEIKLRLDIADRTAKLGIPVDDQLHDLAEAAGFDLSGNANSFVPWDNPDVPYECECGSIIYSDTEHTHGEDEEGLDEHERETFRYGGEDA